VFLSEEKKLVAIVDQAYSTGENVIPTSVIYQAFSRVPTVIGASFTTHQESENIMRLKGGQNSTSYFFFTDTFNPGEALTYLNLYVKSDQLESDQSPNQDKYNQFVHLVEKSFFMDQRGRTVPVSNKQTKKFYSMWMVDYQGDLNPIDIELYQIKNQLWYSFEYYQFFIIEEGSHEVKWIKNGFDQKSLVSILNGGDIQFDGYERVDDDELSNNGIPCDVIMHASLWKRFKDVTGLIPNEMRNIKNKILADEYLDKEFGWILDQREGKILTTVQGRTEKFGKRLDCDEEVLDFFSASIRNLYMRSVKFEKGYKLWEYWDFSFISCTFEDENFDEKNLSYPTALSKSIANGMLAGYLNLLPNMETMLSKLDGLIKKCWPYIAKKSALEGLFLELKYLMILEDEPQEITLNIWKDQSAMKNSRDSSSSSVQKYKIQNINKFLFDEFFDGNNLKTLSLKKIQANTKKIFVQDTSNGNDSKTDEGNSFLSYDDTESYKGNHPWILHEPKSESFPAVDAFLEGVVKGNKILILLQITKSSPSIHASKPEDPGRILLTDWSNKKLANETKKQADKIRGIKSEFTFPGYHTFFVWVGPDHPRPATFKTGTQLSTEYGLRQSLANFTINPYS